jgi:hypothetical protein
MKKFTEFLAANRGMSSLIAKTLGINPTNITNAKTGRLLMPTAWMATIVKLSKRKLSYQTLVQEREVHRLEKAIERTQANKNTPKALS